MIQVEGGMIDFAHHRGHARQALDETIAFSDAIQKALDITKSEEDDTLIIVTSDHSHSMVFSGYASRDKDILDVAQPSKMDNIGYTSLLYGTGGPNNFQFISQNNNVVRPDPYLEDTKSFEYSQQAVVMTDEVTHSGTDVLVYATGKARRSNMYYHRQDRRTMVLFLLLHHNSNRMLLFRRLLFPIISCYIKKEDFFTFFTGPWSHLFHSVHEQTYVAYVIAYAANIGPHLNVSRPGNTSPAIHPPYVTCVLTTFILLIIWHE